MVTRVENLLEDGGRGNQLYYTYYKIYIRTKINRVCLLNFKYNSRRVHNNQVVPNTTIEKWKRDALLEARNIKMKTCAYTQSNSAESSRESQSSLDPRFEWYQPNITSRLYLMSLQTPPPHPTLYAEYVARAYTSCAFLLFALSFWKNVVLGTGF